MFGLAAAQMQNFGPILRYTIERIIGLVNEISTARPSFETTR